MKNKKRLLVLLLFLIVCLIGAGYVYRNFLTVPTSGYNTDSNITDLENSYNDAAQIAKARQKLAENPAQAAVITAAAGGQRSIALTFDGLTDRTAVQQILDLLKKQNAKATFFVDGTQAAEDPENVIAIKKAGHKIENYTLSGLSRMEKLPAERLLADFCRSQKILEVIADEPPHLLKCNNTDYSAALRQAADAAGFKGLVESTAYLDVQKVNAAGTAAGFVASLRPGDIVSVKLQPNVDLLVKEAGKENDRPAVDKQPGLKELPPIAGASGSSIVEAVEKLLLALQAADYTTQYVADSPPADGARTPMKTSFFQQDRPLAAVKKLALELQSAIGDLFTIRKAYAADKPAAQEIKLVYTTQQAVSYTFGGLSNNAAVDDVLKKLNDMGVKATFFVAAVEMKRYPAAVRSIMQNGHEIGIAISPQETATSEQVRASIAGARETLQSQFGVKTDLVKQTSGAVSEATREAVASLDCRLIGQSMNVIQSKHKDYASAEQIMPEIFGKSKDSLVRGSIVYFKMNFYTNYHLVGDLMEKIKRSKIDDIAYAKSYDNPADNPKNDSQYDIKPVGEILNNKKYIYQYPVMKSAMADRVKTLHNGLQPGAYDVVAEMANRYIGNIAVDYGNRQQGFSKTEARRLDTTGLIHTPDNVIFLTIDDWGTDAAVNEMLYVLRKHHVPATFFILTNNVLANPNLLRAIAADGNDIGTHSDKHISMAVRDAKTNRLVKGQEYDDYVRELKTSYEKLQSVVGDVVINGKPALTGFFRPPQMAISKQGTTAVFDAGYSYIVNASSVTEDYRAKSVDEIINVITGDEAGIYNANGALKKGSILLWHAAPAYSAIALDILLTANEAKAAGDPSKFKVGRLADYLTDGYSQAAKSSSGR